MVCFMLMEKHCRKTSKVCPHLWCKRFVRCGANFIIRNETGSNQLISALMAHNLPFLHQIGYLNSRKLKKVSKVNNFHVLSHEILRLCWLLRAEIAGLKFSPNLKIVLHQECDYALKISLRYLDENWCARPKNGQNGQCLLLSGYTNVNLPTWDLPNLSLKSLAMPYWQWKYHYNVTKIFQNLII